MNKVVWLFVVRRKKPTESSNFFIIFRLTPNFSRVNIELTDYNFLLALNFRINGKERGFGRCDYGPRSEDCSFFAPQPTTRYTIYSGLSRPVRSGDKNRF